MKNKPECAYFIEKFNFIGNYDPTWQVLTTGRKKTLLYLAKFFGAKKLSSTCCTRYFSRRRKSGTINSRKDTWNQLSKVELYRLFVLDFRGLKPARTTRYLKKIV